MQLQQLPATLFEGIVQYLALSDKLSELSHVARPYSFPPLTPGCFRHDNVRLTPTALVSLRSSPVTATLLSQSRSMSFLSVASGESTVERTTEIQWRSFVGLLSRPSSTFSASSASVATHVFSQLRQLAVTFNANESPDGSADGRLADLSSLLSSQTICSLPCLVSLYVSFSSFNSHYPSARPLLHSLRRLPFLADLCVSGLSLNSTDTALLLSLPALKHLDLSHCHLFSSSVGRPTTSSSFADSAASSPISFFRPGCRALMLPFPHGEEASDYLTSLLETYVTPKETKHPITAEMTASRQSDSESVMDHTVGPEGQLSGDRTQAGRHVGGSSGDNESDSTGMRLACLKLPERSTIVLERVAAAISSITSISSGPNAHFPSLAVSSFLPCLQSVHCSVTDDEAGVAARCTSLRLFVACYSTQLRVIDITLQYTTIANLDLLSCVFDCHQLAHLSLRFGNHNAQAATIPSEFSRSRVPLSYLLTVHFNGLMLSDESCSVILSLCPAVEELKWDDVDITVSVLPVIGQQCPKLRYLCLLGSLSLFSRHSVDELINFVDPHLLQPCADEKEPQAGVPMQLFPCLTSLYVDYTSIYEKQEEQPIDCRLSLNLPKLFLSAPLQHIHLPLSYSARGLYRTFSSFTQLRSFSLADCPASKLMRPFCRQQRTVDESSFLVLYELMEAWLIRTACCFGPTPSRTMNGDSASWWDEMSMDECAYCTQVRRRQHSRSEFMSTVAGCDVSTGVVHAIQCTRSGEKERSVECDGRTAFFSLLASSNLSDRWRRLKSALSYTLHRSGEGLADRMRIFNSNLARHDPWIV